MTDRKRLLQIAVIGLGNPLMGDDGFGIAALERLQTEREMEPFVHLVDGGTWGLSLLPIIEAASHVLILDAIRAGHAPGTLVMLEDDEVPRRLSTKLSPHQIDLREILALCQLRGTMPEKLVAVGVEPLRVELHDGLSHAVAAKMDEVLALAVDRLHVWGGISTRAHALVG